MRVKKEKNKKEEKIFQFEGEESYNEGNTNTMHHLVQQSIIHNHIGQIIGTNLTKKV